MDALATLKIQKHTHDLIITHAQALYGSKHPDSIDQWGVIASAKDGGYTAHAIVYSGLRHKHWTCLMSSQRVGSVGEAEKRLLEALRGELGRGFV